MAQSHYAKLKRECAPPNATKLRRLLYFIARRTYGVYLQKNYRIQHLNHEFLHDLKGPYVIVANHVNNSDPFIYNILCPYPIAWIIGKSIERESKFPYLLKVLRTIGRNKEMSDLDTVKKIRQWIGDGEVVGIFPEGQTSLTGLSQPIPEATAKLLRFLKVPVVSLRNEGGYFAQPRWAWGPRISSREAGAGIVLRYELLFDAAQIQSAKLSEIQQRVQAALDYDPYDASREACDVPVPLHGQAQRSWGPYLDRGLRQQNLAESLELVLHSCLDCLDELGSAPSGAGSKQNPKQNPKQNIGTMHSCRMELHCRACGATWRISEDSHFLFKDGGFCYSLQEYYQRQLELMQGLASRLCVQKDFARVRMYKKSRLQGSWKEGCLVLDSEGLRLLGQTGADIGFELKQVFACHVFKHNILEFHATYQGDSALFVLEFPNKADSAFLVLDSLRALQEALPAVFAEGRTE